VESLVHNRHRLRRHWRFVHFGSCHNHKKAIEITIIGIKSSTLEEEYEVDINLKLCIPPKNHKQPKYWSIKTPGVLFSAINA
jgi:hypothetical protein